MAQLLDFTAMRLGKRIWDSKIVLCPKCSRKGFHASIDTRGGHSVYHTAELLTGLHVREWCYIKADAWKE
jgi:hypothetical protein